MKPITLAVPIVALLAGVTLADSMQELHQRFEQRYPQILQLEHKGIVGETQSGYLEVVKHADAAQRKLMEEENHDRRELYQLVAKQENTTPEVVANLNAERNYERAKSGDYLLDQEGEWKKK